MTTSRAPEGAPAGARGEDEGAERIGDASVADAPLPPTWWWAAAAGVAAAAILWLWHDLADPPGTQARYRADRAAALDDGAVLSEDALYDLAADALAVETGAEAFGDHCATCHGPAGRGTDQGPSLVGTDSIAESSAVEIFTTIVEGRAEDGMPPWASLGRGLCMQITAYILTLRDAEGGAGEPPSGSDSPP